MGFDASSLEEGKGGNSPRSIFWRRTLDLTELVLYGPKIAVLKWVFSTRSPELPGRGTADGAAADGVTDAVGAVKPLTTLLPCVAEVTVGAVTMEEAVRL